MKFQIHFTWPDGTEDSFVAEGNTLEEIQQLAQEGVAKRQGQNPWSEEIK